jgi:hypothetical protein
MDSAQHKSRGYNASLPARLQVANTIHTMSAIKDGHDIRKWSATARRELAASDEVIIYNQQGDAVSAAPKLALVVVSSVFRDFFRDSPDAQGVKFPAIVDDAAVCTLIAWLRDILHCGGKFGVSLPTYRTDLLKIRHAAHVLGMDLYTRHFCKAYKDDLRNRTPPIDECELIERIAIEPVDDALIGLGERLAYLRRRGDFNETSITILAQFLTTHPKIAQAVYAADARSAHVRGTTGQGMK